MNEIYDTFLKTLTDIYDANFPIREYILKDKDIKSPWISKGLKKSSKPNKGYTSNFFRLKTNFLHLLSLHWWEKSPILKNHFKTF